jgi:hypothetical protein
MQSRNIKSIRWAGVMVILLAFFVCLGLKKASRCSYSANAHYIKRSSPIRTLNCMHWRETLRKFWKSGSSRLRYFMFTSVPRSAVSHGWKSGFRTPKGLSDGLKDRKPLIGIKH